MDNVSLLLMSLEDFTNNVYKWPNISKVFKNHKAQIFKQSKVSYIFKNYSHNAIIWRHPWHIFAAHRFWNTGQESKQNTGKRSSSISINTTGTITLHQLFISPLTVTIFVITTNYNDIARIFRLYTQLTLTLS